MQPFLARHRLVRVLPGSCAAPFLVFAAMPLAVINAEEKAAALASLDPTFAFLLEEHGVELEVQAGLGHIKVRNMEIFGRLEDGAAAMRLWLRDGFGLDGGDATTRVQMSSILVVAWDAARERVARRATVEAERRATGLPSQMLRGDHPQLRRSYEKAKRELPDNECPGKGYMEYRMDQITEGELEAEKLTQVTAVSDEASPGRYQNSNVDIRRDGVLQVRTSKHSVPEPTTPEELRRRYRLMRRHWAFVRFRGHGREYLRDFEEDVFDRFAEYILGPDGWQLQGEDSDGRPVPLPSWTTILRWEYELRKAAIKLVNHGETLAVAMRKVENDTELRVKYLVSPLALGAGRGSRRPGAGLGSADHPEAAETGYEPVQKKRKGDPKGQGTCQGKGKVKGKLAAGAGGQAAPNYFARARRDPALAKHLKLKIGGKDICFLYQAEKGCNRTDCTWLHNCAHCGEEGHGYHGCPTRRY